MILRRWRPSSTGLLQPTPSPAISWSVQLLLAVPSKFATIAKPLHQLTEETWEFLWTDHCENAVRKLNRKLTSAPILAFPDFTKQIILNSDVSNEGIGTILSQVDDG